MEEVCNRADLILFDLKSIDNERHRQYTGSPNEAILKNLDTALHSGTEIRIRIPLVAGFNDGEKDLAAMRDFLASYGNIRHVDILPYHHYASHKYREFQPENNIRNFKAPGREAMGKIIQNFESSGYTVTIGG
jgi:pyruvate formate lyase activating enzyme